MIVKIYASGSEPDFNEICVQRLRLEIPSRALPARKIFEDLGFRYSSDIASSPHAVSAELPPGWSVEHNTNGGEMGIGGWLLDVDGQRRAEIIDVFIEESGFHLYELRLLPDHSIEHDFRRFNEKFKG